MAGPQWQKSSYSGGGDGDDCVELRVGGGGLLLRESDDPERVLTLEPEALGGLLRCLKAPGRASP